LTIRGEILWGVLLSGWLVAGSAGALPLNCSIWNEGLLRHRSLKLGDLIRGSLWS